MRCRGNTCAEEDHGHNDPTSGTAWTEPGQGATVAELWHEIDRVPKLRPPRVSDNTVFSRTRYDWGMRTNLALTGAPLTAEDVKRIAAAK